LGLPRCPTFSQLNPVLEKPGLSDLSFFVLSVLCIPYNLTLAELGAHIECTGRPIRADDLNNLVNKEMLAIENSSGQERYRLTAAGREASLHQIAEAKGIEEELITELSSGDVMAMKLLLKRFISKTDPGLPDLWAGA